MPSFMESLSKGPLGFGEDALDELGKLPIAGLGVGSGVIRSAMPRVLQALRLRRAAPMMKQAMGPVGNEIRTAMSQASELTPRVRPGYSSIPTELSGIGEAQRPWIGVKPALAQEGSAALNVPKSYKNPNMYDLTADAGENVMDFLAKLKDESVNEGSNLHAKLRQLGPAVDLNDPAFIRNAELFKSLGY